MERLGAFIVTMIRFESGAASPLRAIVDVSAYLMALERDDDRSTVIGQNYGEPQSDDG